MPPPPPPPPPMGGAGVAYVSPASRGPVEMRPLRLGEVYDGSLKLYRARFGSLIAVAAIILSPLIAVEMAGTQVLLDRAATVTSYLQLEQLLRQLVILGVAVTVLQLLVAGPLMAAASIRIIAATYLGEKVSIGAAIGLAFRRFFPLLGAIILAAVPLLVFFAVLGGLALVSGGSSAFVLLSLTALIGGVLLAIWVYTMFLFKESAIVVEGVGPIKALKRSYALVRGKEFGQKTSGFQVSGPSAGGRIFGTMFLAYIMIGILNGIVGAVTNGMITDPSMVLPAVAIQHAFGILIAPFITGTVVLLYFDQRIRREGFDLAVMAQELTQQPGA